MLHGVLLIARNDFVSLLRSPLGWCALALVQLIVGLFFVVVVVWDFMATQPALVAGESSFGLSAYVAAPTFKSAGLILLLVTPLLGMGSFAGERRQGSLPLLLSSPVSMSSLVLGKYLGLLGVLLLMVGLISLMPLSLRLGGHLDMGLLAACVLGLGLLAASFAAVTVYVSSLCRQPAAAAMGALAVLVALWSVDGGNRGGDTALASQVLGYLCLSRHFDAFMRGVFSTADLTYFVLLTVTFLALALRRLDAVRTAA